MDLDSSSEIVTIEQKVEQVLYFARTFRKHPLILFGRKEISPYDLASNGFVNKHFKEDEKDESFDDNHLKPVTCVCQVPECSKVLKFNSFDNQKYQNEDDEEEIEEMLTQHEENCSLHKKKFSKLAISQLFSIAHLLFNQIIESFKKDQSSTIQRFKINWNLVEECILQESEPKGRVNILFECYKTLDHRFDPTIKRITYSILLSLFGWKLQSIGANNSVVLKCHFCSRKVSKEVTDNFDFLNEHNLWCLIRRNESQLWKVILKKKYTLEKDQPQITKKTHEFVLPKRTDQIESKEIREEIFHIAQPVLQQIEQLMDESLDIVRKQKHFDEELSKRSKEKYQEIEDYLGKYKNLDGISKKCQEIITNFINSIEPRRN